MHREGFRDRSALSPPSAETALPPSSSSRPPSSSPELRPSASTLPSCRRAPRRIPVMAAPRREPPPEQGRPRLHTNPCGTSSAKTLGRIPGGGVVCRRGAKYSSFTSPSLVLSAFSSRMALCVATSTDCAEWWRSASDKTIDTVIRSGRKNERSWRSLADEQRRVQLSWPATGPRQVRKTTLVCDRLTLVLQGEHVVNIRSLVNQ